MGKTKTKSRSVGDSPKPPITIRSTNVKILDDNIAKLEKAIQAGDVSANPSGTAEETLLSTIGIDGKKYELGPSAENTSYDNTDSGLTAEDVQSAIDEVSSASGISYDNTDSGLTADDVQAAIDEIWEEETLTPTSTVITDLTKVKVLRYGRMIIVSFIGAVLTSNVGKYGKILEGLTNANEYALNFIVSVNGTTETNTSVYINSNSGDVQINSAITSGDALWGSLIYMV